MSVYLRELINQSKFAEIAAVDLNGAIDAGADGLDRAFLACQSFLAAAAMMSKTISGDPPQALRPGAKQDQKTRFEALKIAARDRGAALRQIFEPQRISILHKRAVRNSLEHFDHRLDEFIYDSPDGNIFDRVITDSPETIIQVNGAPPRYLRLINLASGTISVLKDELRLQELFDATTYVGQRAAMYLEEQREARIRDLMPDTEPEGSDPEVP